jgi:hypothetical protein
MSTSQNASQTASKRRTKYFWTTKQVFTASENAVTFVKEEGFWQVKKRYTTVKGSFETYSCNGKDCKAAIRIFMLNENNTAEI